jgi:hypothetical protein
MTFVGFKQPREKNEKYLNFIRSQPCCICGAINTEAAHIRTASLEHGKRGLGMQEKSSDAWALPLCNEHHREQHADGNELRWWASKGKNPFELAISFQRRGR